MGRLKREHFAKEHSAIWLPSDYMNQGVIIISHFTQEVEILSYVLLLMGDGLGQFDFEFYIMNIFH